ncbi:hypothetical protein D9M71_806030 [compost metagenome]
MVVEYCGYNGSTTIRRMPSAASRSSSAVSAGAPYRMAWRTRRLGISCCMASARRRVYTIKGDPSGSQTWAYLAAERPLRSGRITP